MMHNKLLLVALASKIFPRRFAPAKRASYRRHSRAQRRLSDEPLASKTLEPRGLIDALSAFEVLRVLRPQGVAIVGSVSDTSGPDVAKLHPDFVPLEMLYEPNRDYDWEPVRNSATLLGTIEFRIEKLPDGVDSVGRL